jgi:anti-sigma-K factor RskA
MSRDHEQYEENVGAYLLGALNELEAEVFERHVASCPICRQEFEQLRVASEALPRAVEPVEPPASLKKSLMETVMAEAKERGQTAPARKRFWQRPFPRLTPAFAAGMACVVLAIGVAIGFGISSTGGGSDKTVAALVDHSRVPMGSATLTVRDNRAKGGVLNVEGMPQPGSNRVYEVWVHRGGSFVPAGALFDVRKDGTGSAAIPTNLKGVDAVAVTREPQGGTDKPSEEPVMTFKLA